MNPNETRLFLSVTGTPISPESVEKLVQRLMRRAEIPQVGKSWNADTAQAAENFDRWLL